MTQSKCPGCQGDRRRPHSSAELIEHHPEASPSCPACMEFRLHTPDEYRLCVESKQRQRSTGNGNQPGTNLTETSRE